MADRLTNLLVAVQDASRSLQGRKAATVVEALPAIDAIQAALVAALDDGPLRSVKNLGTGAHRFYGARLRSQDPDEKLRWPAPGAENDDDVLCLDLHGHLCLVRCWRRNEAPDLLVWWARADELRAEDLAALLETLTKILPRHVRHCQDTGERWGRIGRLASAVYAILGTPVPCENCKAGYPIAYISQARMHVDPNGTVLDCTLPEAPETQPSAERGDIVCYICGRPYFMHPLDRSRPDCDGKRLKL